jgi:hypothetical protein
VEVFFNERSVLTAAVDTIGFFDFERAAHATSQSAFYPITLAELKDFYWRLNSPTVDMLPSNPICTMWSTSEDNAKRSGVEIEQGFADLVGVLADEPFHPAESIAFDQSMLGTCGGYLGASMGRGTEYPLFRVVGNGRL